MKSQKTFIVSVVIIILFVVGLGVFMNKQSNKPSKYDDFAKALKAEGAEFFGAFWCPHCKAEKELFGNAKQYLPYIECSNPDQSQTQICLDNKIESYPTWRFKNGITLTSASSAPTVCAIKPGTPNEPPVCANASSANNRTWIFPEYRFSIKSPTDPIQEGTTWKFPSDATATGEVPLDFLAQQIGFTLPQ